MPRRDAISDALFRQHAARDHAERVVCLDVALVLLAGLEAGRWSDKALDMLDVLGPAAWADLALNGRFELVATVLGKIPALLPQGRGELAELDPAFVKAATAFLDDHCQNLGR